MLDTCARCGHRSGVCPRCGRTTHAMFRVGGQMYCGDWIDPGDWDNTCSDIAEREAEDAAEAKVDHRAASLRARNKRTQRIHEANVAATPGQLGEILALHKPVWPEVGSYARDWPGSYRPECGGCEFSGYEAEAPWWPCKTYRIASRHLGARALLNGEAGDA